MVKKSFSASKWFKANTAVVLVMENGTDDDEFGIEFSPHDSSAQCMDNLTYYPLMCNGERVTMTNKDVPFTFVTPCTGAFRLVNLGFDDTGACVNMADSYEVIPYVARSSC